MSRIREAGGAPTTATWHPVPVNEYLDTRQPSWLEYEKAGHVVYRRLIVKGYTIARVFINRANAAPLVEATRVPALKEEN